MTNDPRDVCTKSEDAGECTLGWNLTPQAEQALLQAVKILGPRGATLAPPPTFCDGPPTPACAWIGLLRRPDAYNSVPPETIGLGFLLFTSVAFAADEQRDPDVARALLSEIENATAIGSAVLGRGGWKIDKPTYTMRAAFGCTDARSARGQRVVVQDMRSRSERSCSDK
jgi:hypothetical protein